MTNLLKHRGIISKYLKCTLNIVEYIRRYNNQLTLMRRDLRNCKGKIAEQQKQILEYASRMDETDKKNEETSRKFSTLLQVSAHGQQGNRIKVCD